MVDGGGQRLNDDKNPLELVPPSLMFAVGAVLAEGAKKYERHNWTRGMKWSVVLGSLMRHLFKWASPFHNDKDEETGYNHMWHVAANVAFLIEYEKTCPELDDRVNYNKKHEDDIKIEVKVDPKLKEDEWYMITEE